VVVARKEPGGEWFQPVRVPPLGKDPQFPIAWAAHVSRNRLGAAYEAIDGSPHTSECANDLTRLYDESRLPVWEEQQIERTGPWNRDNEVQRDQLANSRARSALGTRR
jgi:hypothetical protein